MDDSSRIRLIPYPSLPAFGKLNQTVPGRDRETNRDN